MEPDIPECIGGVIAIFYFFKSVQRVFLVIEGHIDRKVDLLLPVLGENCERETKRYQEYNCNFSHQDLFYQK
jgi:hypothetical protein